MLERLIEQKLPIMAVLANDKTLLLRDEQWALAEKVIEMLRPFEAVTRKLSLKSACISQMIPFVETMKKQIEKSLDNQYLLSAKRQMLKGFFKLLIKYAAYILN